MYPVLITVFFICLNQEWLAKIITNYENINTIFQNKEFFKIKIILLY